MASDAAKSGRFEIVRQLAEGGMAELLLCWERRGDGTKRLVVIKRILRHMRDRPEAVEMFRHEAAIAIGLKHPNLVEAYESGRATDGDYLSMEYLDGLDLGEILEGLGRAGQRLDLADAVEIVRGVCAALDYLHELRDGEGQCIDVVHRDVCPHNVIITAAGTVKLVDFGIASSRSRLAVPTGGRMKGRATYMSPEQLRGEEIDRRSDVFAAAVVLWELTTGHRLYLRKNQLATIRAIVDEPARAPSQVVPGYPEELEAIVLAGLEREREARIASAGELGRRLEDFMTRHALESSSERLAGLVRRLGPATPAGGL